MSDVLDIVIFVVVVFVLIVPLWKIFEKTGRSPWLSLLIFVPAVGAFIAILILAFGRWPAVDGPAPTS